jgi:hypothetical protein
MLWPGRMSRWWDGRRSTIVWQLDVRHVIRPRGRHGRRDEGWAGVRRVERVRTGRCGRLEAVLSVLNGGEHCICPILGGTAYLAMARRHWNDRREDGGGGP